MNIAHDRAEFRTSFASQTDGHVQGYTDPAGKLVKDSNSWEVWSTCFANLLLVIPAMIGIPLPYVIPQIVYSDFMEECVAFATLLKESDS